jgi:hypothetical protein
VANSGKAVQGSWSTNGGELHVWIQWLFICLWPGKTNMHTFVPVQEFAWRLCGNIPVALTDRERQNLHNDGRA